MQMSCHMCIVFILYLHNNLPQCFSSHSLLVCVGYSFVVFGTIWNSVHYGVHLRIISVPVAIYDISLRLMTWCLISPLWFSCVVGVFQIALELPWCILVLLLFSEVEICLKQSISYLYGIFHKHKT
ncbi:hypothetical protein PRUPE_7G222500 [Prunus persica]|uniref:Uncharacterized protein n=1 Tax=Prunus persica TaxID=3760 RepID=A0A251NF90_PRUPE|nr:hypothetical protein PRUPE_7G222500 [Prunus persica]